MSLKYTVRQGRREDMAGLLKLSLEEGWNVIIEHLYFIFDSFPEGVYVAEGADGEIISHCASIPLDDSNGSITFYITKKSLRRQGIGKKVFDLSFKALENRNVGLNAVWDVKEMYGAGHFKITSSTLLAYTFPVKHLKLEANIESQNSTVKIFDTKVVELARILAYDERIHLLPREKIVKWVLEFAHVGRVLVEDDKIKGWGTIYRTHRGYCLMPLYSDTPEVAKALAHNLLEHIMMEPEVQIEICFPEENKAAQKMYEDIGAFTGEYDCSKLIKMFTEYNIPVPTQLVYSVLNYAQTLI